MKYYFSGEMKSDGRSCRLVLRTEDPDLHREGFANVFFDIDTRKLDVLAAKKINEELRKAQQITELLQGEAGKELRDKVTEDQRMEARELFDAMENNRDNLAELIRLNEEFTGLTRRAQDLELLYSLKNPWVHYYNAFMTGKKKKALMGFYVNATILDKNWFRRKHREGEEPDLKILSYEPVFFFQEARDVFPEEWLALDSERLEM